MCRQQVAAQCGENPARCRAPLLGDSGGDDRLPARLGRSAVSHVDQPG
ncbi:hypothetical protein ACN27F_26255 [Solwaraspora sp. WMMB335]